MVPFTGYVVTFSGAVSVGKLSIDLGNASLRNRVLLTMSCLLALAGLSAALMNFYSNSPIWIGIIQMIGASVFCYVSINLLQDKSKPWFNVAVIYTYIALITFSLVSLNPGNTVIQWWYSIPVLCFFVLSKRHSLIVCCLMLAFAIYHHISNNLIIFERNWYSGVINLIFPYLIIMALSYTYEKVRLKNEYELTEYALQDSLTKVFNRLALVSFFPKFQMSELSYSLVLLDIDHFKKINDVYGHDAGDFILSEVAKLFTKQLGTEHVFRIGGEEFVLLISNVSENELITAESIRELIQQHTFLYAEQKIQLSFSAGLVRGIKDNELPDILKLADQNLYQAKHNGRNCIVS